MRCPKPSKPPKMQPPMTPMIDCTFNLLIFFILTPSFSMTEGYLTTNLPTTSGPVAGKAQIDVQRIKIELQHEGTRNENVSIILENGTPMGANFDQLTAELKVLRERSLAASLPILPILISPTMATHHKWVVRAFDAAVAARFTDIQFAVPYD